MIIIHTALAFRFLNVYRRQLAVRGLRQPRTRVQMLARAVRAAEAHKHLTTRNYVTFYSEYGAGTRVFTYSSLVSRTLGSPHLIYLPSTKYITRS